MINILVLNWNSAESASQCLNCIARSDDQDFRVVLISNYSSNKDKLDIRDVYEVFKCQFELHLLENNENLGYAGGNNEGLNYLTRNNLLGDILILNPDIRISINTISEMKKALVEDVGIVTVRTLDPQGRILFDAIQLRGFCHHNLITDQAVIPTDFSQGSCLLISRDAIDKVGLFDERFFLYWEEVDFSLRVKSLGRKLVSITSTHIIKNNNNIDSRLPGAFYYSVRNARLIKEKHIKTFSEWAYRYYLLKMFVLTFKFIPKPSLFFRVTINYYSAINDSLLNNYYSKSQK